MKKYLISILSFFIFVSTSVVASAADKVTLQLQWFTQAQFAGYYVALDNGYYSDEGLDVTIKPGGVDISPPQVMAAGGADVMLNWMPSALSARAVSYTHLTLPTTPYV